MDASEIDVLVQRLVANPHDQEALAYAHNAGNADPKSYAVFLEKVGNATADPAYASHWLSEAANVWSITLGRRPPRRARADDGGRQGSHAGDRRRAARAALPRQGRAQGPRGAARAPGEGASARWPGRTPSSRLHLAGIHEELGRLWSEAPLSLSKEGCRELQASDRARRHVRLRGLRPARAVQAGGAVGRRGAALRDGAGDHHRSRAQARALSRRGRRSQARRRSRGRNGVLRQARAVAQDDPALMQELGASILDRIQAGDAVSPTERQEAADLFVSLAEIVRRRARSSLLDGRSRRDARPRSRDAARRALRPRSRAHRQSSRRVGRST